MLALETISSKVSLYAKFFMFMSIFIRSSTCRIGSSCDTITSCSQHLSRYHNSSLCYCSHSHSCWTSVNTIMTAAVLAWRGGVTPTFILMIHEIHARVITSHTIIHHITCLHLSHLENSTIQWLDKATANNRIWHLRMRLRNKNSS